MSQNIGNKEKYVQLYAYGRRILVYVEDQTGGWIAQRIQLRKRIRQRKRQAYLLGQEI